MDHRDHHTVLAPETACASQGAALRAEHMQLKREKDEANRIRSEADSARMEAERAKVHCARRGSQHLERIEYTCAVGGYFTS